MARSPFPRADFGRTISEAPIGGGIGAPAAGSTGALADAAQRFGGRVRKMAEDAWVREGERDAARVIEASQLSGIDPALRPERGIDDQAYNVSVRGQLLASRQAAYVEEQGRLEIEHPDSETRWAESATAVRAAFRPTGDPEIDIAFQRFATLQDAQALGRVRQRQEATRRETVRGAFVQTASVAGTALGQAVASAGVDDQGAALVGASLNQFASQLARFGPREAFTIGGMEFAADPTRAGVVSPEVLAQEYDRAQRTARTEWILGAGDRAPDARSKAAYLGQVRERWEMGDAMFAGLDATDMARVTGRLEADVARAQTDERARVAATASMVRDMITAGEYGGAVDPEQLRAAALASGDPGLQAEVEWRLTHGFDITPARLRELTMSGQGAGGQASVLDFILDDLEGSGLVANDNGRGRAQWGITEASHPQAWADGRVDRAEAAAIYKREYIDASGAGSLSPEMQLVVSAAAVVGGVGTARELLAQSGNDPERFLQLEMARFERLARENPAKYADDLPGWRNRQGKVRGMLGGLRQQVRSREGFISDPLGFAAGSGSRPPLATVSPHDPLGVFGEAADVQAWAQGVRANVGVSEDLTRQYSVPTRVFSNDEVEIYKQAVEQDPANLMKLAGGLIAAVGPDRARMALGEMGRQGFASADIHLAALAMDDLTAPSATLALEGRALRASGAAVPAFDKGDESAAPTIRGAVQGITPLLQSLPEVVPAIEQLATDMSVADAARGRLRPPLDYVNAALGAVRRGDHVFGGLGVIERGRSRAGLVLPTWLRSDGAEEALDLAIDQMTEADIGPAYSNGQPIPPARLREYRPVRTRRGYGFVNPETGSFVSGREGQIFEFDLASDQFRQSVATRHPELVAR